MNEQNKNNKQYTAADIAKYHMGELSAKEMHELEKAALEDPFLADALEGYSNTTSANSDLDDLTKKLLQKTDRGKLIPVKKKENTRQWLRIAALFLLLFGAGWIVYRLNLTDERNIASGTTKKHDEKLQQPGLLQEALPDSINITSKKDAADQSGAVNRVQNAGKKTRLQETETLTSIAAKDKQDVATTPQGNSESVAEKTSPKLLQADAVKEKESASSVSRKRSLSAPVAGVNSFSGQVINNKGKPVPYATLMFKKMDTAIQTDSKGNFAITSRDSLIAATVTAVGYHPNRFYMNNPGVESKIILKESEAELSEVVVTGYGTQRRSREVVARQAAVLPVPIGGWNKFQDYILNNIKKQDTSGEVHLSFDISRNGEPKSIKVEKPLCDECDKEAIRLLKEGPKWKTTKGKKGKVAIKF